MSKGTSKVATEVRSEATANLVTPDSTKLSRMLTSGVSYFDAKDSEQVEMHVRLYFRDAPIMAEIAACESHFRHLMKNGDPIRGEVNRGDIGVMQVNEYYHREDAEDMGHDIDTLDGNLKYARFLYEKYGTKPWDSSKKCWGPAGVELAKVQ